MADSVRLQKLLERISDGTAVDWNEAGSLAQTPEDEVLLGNLRVVAAIGELARSGGGDRDDLRDTMSRAAERVGAPEANGDVYTVDTTLETWGDLRMLECIGTGSFGEVWRAWDARLNREVALKLIATGHADTDERRARILEEGRMLAKVEHPNVARIYGIDEHEGRIGFWMERIDGRDLRQIMEDHGPLPIDEVVAIGIELAEAVAAVHAAGVIHGDIKPANVMRNRSGRIILTDFGVGSRRVPHDDRTSRPASGTPLFLPPELFEDEHASPRSDIYSLGVLLHHLATGTYPVTGRDLDGLIEAHRKGERKSVREGHANGTTTPSIPVRIADTIDRATAPARADRFATADSMAQALRDAQSSDTHGDAGNAQPPLRKTRRSQSVALIALTLLAVAFALTRFSSAPAPILGQAAYEAWRDGSRRTLTNGAPVTPADRIALALSIEPRAHVYLLNLDEAGAITVLFPMEGHPLENPIPGGETIALPGTFGGERQGWTLSPDRGTERFLLIASREPLVTFEETLARYPSIVLGGGLSARPLGSGAVRELTRGVSGMAGIVSPPAVDEIEPADLLIDLMRQIATDGERRGDLWMEEIRFENGGS